MSIVKKVLDGNWVELQSEFEKQIADKIWSKVQDKKIDVLAKINGVTREKMEEVMSVKMNEKKYMVDASGNKIEPTQIDKYDFDNPLTHESTDDFDGLLKRLSDLPDTNYGALYFKGVFALWGLKGQDLGNGRRQHTYIPRKNLIADHGSWDLDEERAIKLIKNEYPDANEEQLDVIKRVAIYEKSIWNIVEAEYDGENILSELISDDLGEVGWMLQGLRGQIAADQGFDAIEMYDEHGTSYLIPIGSKALYLGQIENWDEYHKIVDRLKGTK